MKKHSVLVALTTNHINSEIAAILNVTMLFVLKKRASCFYQEFIFSGQKKKRNVLNDQSLSGMSSLSSKSSVINKTLKNQWGSLSISPMYQMQQSDARFRKTSDTNSTLWGEGNSCPLSMLHGRAMWSGWSLLIKIKPFHTHATPTFFTLACLI